MSEIKRAYVLWDRLITLGFFVVIFAISYGLIQGLWLLDKVILAIFLTLLAPVKFVIIIISSYRLRHDVKGNYLLYVILFLCVLFFAFYFDEQTILLLWANRIGDSTVGTAEGFLIKSKNTHFITYEFQVNEMVFTKEQGVTIPFYESLKPGSSVSVKYISEYPTISFLVDMNYLKTNALFYLAANLYALMIFYQEIFLSLVYKLFR